MVPVRVFGKPKVIASGPEKPGAPTPSVDNKLRRDWNDYTAWLEKQGMKGNPQLDKGGLGFTLLEKYRKENPATTVTKEAIPVIQQEFQKYKQYALDRIKAKKAMFSEGTNEQNFMKNLSVVDGIPGQYTTSFAFPPAYLTTFENGKQISTEKTEFAPSK
jgi:hypothetical protein